MSIHFISFSSFWNGNLVRNLIAGIDRLLYGILNFQISPMELTFEANYSICSSELASLTSNLIYHCEFEYACSMATKKAAEEIACSVAVLSARTSPIARNQGGKRKFPVLASFLLLPLGKRKW